VVALTPILNNVKAIPAVVIFKFISPATGSLALSTTAARNSAIFSIMYFPSAFLISCND
jgi:hypothetical protein